MGGGRYPPLPCRAPGRGRAAVGESRSSAGRRRRAEAGSRGLECRPGRAEASPPGCGGLEKEQGAGACGVVTAQPRPLLSSLAWEGGGEGGHRAEEPPAPFSGGNELQGLTTGFDSRDEGSCTAALSPPRHSLVPACPRERSPGTEHARTPNDLAHGKLAFPLVGQKIGKTTWSLVGDARPGPQPAGTNVNSVWH